MALSKINKFILKTFNLRKHFIITSSIHKATTYAKSPNLDNPFLIAHLGFETFTQVFKTNHHLQNYLKNATLAHGSKRSCLWYIWSIHLGVFKTYLHIQQKKLLYLAYMDDM